MNTAINSEARMRAFTLIEVLVAIVVFAIVLVAINTVFFAGVRLRERTTAAVEATIPVDRAIGIMKRDIAGIVPPGTLAGAMSSDTKAVGLVNPAALEIFTTSGQINEDYPWSDVQKIDYLLEAPTNRNAFGRDLVRAVTHNLLATTTITPEQQTLLQGVNTLKFSYYDGTNWNDSWSQTLSNIPVAIRVSIDFTTDPSITQPNIPVQILVPVVMQSRTNQVSG